jgi:hypothetical protein
MKDFFSELIKRIPALLIVGGVIFIAFALLKFEISEKQK